ncbi:hypothetical protein [Bradyrhizobium sp. RDM4]|uniref:hypothetical protein n=1 Tax=Bradyrhizobium sp. RDM4 TaxID=3378765 RepID=UPI0038FC0614
MSTVDPTAVLRTIAADKSAPASARVAAAKALLLLEKGDEDRKNPGDQNQRISQRALRVLNGGKP